MATDTNVSQVAAQRPMRADARRNYDKLIAAARAAFTEGDSSSASLEDIARRAGVGIGTLYRHFPTRKDLLAGVYREEVEAICRSAADFADLPPWESLVAWLHRFVGYAATKRALADELVSYVDADDEVFRSCRVAVNGTGDALLDRAKASGDVRPDAVFADVGRMVVGIATIRGARPDEVERILDLALDGLRYRRDV
jgi:AcrR family transcriptional regulator